MGGHSLDGFLSGFQGVGQSVARSKLGLRAREGGEGRGFVSWKATRPVGLCLMNPPLKFFF